MSYISMNVPLDTPMRQSLAKYAGALTAFASSNSTFRILHSVPQPGLPPPKTIYVLDSSFNPPTLAHLHIATSALLRDTHPSPSPKRLLLLLATQNADKAPKPASFDQRLLMMQIFASDLLSTLSKSNPPSSSNESPIGIDIGVTKLPYFIDKAVAISQSDAYPPSATQVHLTGFDTLIRILDPKYYPPEKKLGALDGFLAQHRLRVAYRAGDKWGGKAAQDEYLQALGRGEREKDGAKREWVSEGRIVMCEGQEEGEGAVSSTRVREAVKNGDRELLSKLVTSGVAEWILEEGLYSEE
jgi:nicotinamide-nucleotide adenylyltransferase